MRSIRTRPRHGSANRALALAHAVWTPIRRHSIAGSAVAVVRSIRTRPRHGSAANRALAFARAAWTPIRDGSTRDRRWAGGSVAVGALGAGLVLWMVIGAIASAIQGPATHQTRDKAINRLLNSVALEVTAYEQHAAALANQPLPPPTTTTTTTIPPTTTTTIPPTTTTTAAPAPVTDATSVDTPDWACIRNAESGNGSGSSNLYGFLGPAWSEYGDSSYSSAGAAPPSVQGQAALRLYRANGDKFSGAWNDPCTQAEGGPLA